MSTNSKAASRINPEASSKPTGIPVQIANGPSSGQSSAIPLPKLAFTMQQTAQILNISYMSVFRLQQRGLLKSSRALRTKMIPLTEIQRFLRVTTEILLLLGLTRAAICPNKCNLSARLQTSVSYQVQTAECTAHNYANQEARL
jgi:hypothetical protein